MKKNIISIPATYSMSKIQECFKEQGCTIKFLSGNTYNITKTLTVYSNTNIVIEKGATLIRKTDSHVFRGYVNPDKDYQYNAVVNVTISGEGTIKNGIKKTGSMIGFIHGNNITIKDITISGTYKSHAIDMPACKNVTIDNVKFKDRVVDPKYNYKEEIQYDYAMSAAYPYFNAKSKVYNDNQCENITIKNCTFTDANFCIGTHTETNSSKQHKNIQVINCTANGRVVDGDGIFVKIINTDGAIIKGNKIKGFSRGIVVMPCNKFYSSHGVKYDKKPSTKTGSKNIKIENNSISNAYGNVKAAGIYVTSYFDDLIHSNITIKNNKFRLNNMSAKYDIFVEHAKCVTEDNNDTILDVVIK
jgi:hypothetical protein